MKAARVGSLLWVMGWLVTVWVSWRAVANKEISFYRLKARKKAGSHLRSVRRSMTVWVSWRAVANEEISFID